MTWPWGKIVEGISHSKFWKSTLILIVEDDAQNGLDHVDGHRTVALAISPYTKRGSVDSTFYSQVSMVKTIELIMGVPPMSLFDLIANDMRASFQSTPDLTPYESLEPTQSLFDVNPNLNALHGQAKADALASSKMDWKDPDDAPAEQVNQILWRNAKGTEHIQPGSVALRCFTPHRDNNHTARSLTGAWPVGFILCLH